MLKILSENGSDLSFDYAGLFTSDEEWIHPHRIIDSYEILYVLSGDVFLEEDGERYSMKPGDIFVLRPGVAHGGWQKSYGHTSFYWAHFYVSDFDMLGIAAGLQSTRDDYRLSSYFKQLLHINNSTEYPSYARDMSIGILLGELAAANTAQKQSHTELSHRVAEWIRINRDKKLTVASVASHFGYHPDYLCTLHKKTFGKSMKMYINSERIQYAKHMLLTSPMSVKELSAALGWEDEGLFIHYFRYHEGISPSRYRNNYFKTHMNKK
ncbi:MAG: helix-turn-helix domain-containing protein [Eubacteriales bacterium]